MASDVPPSQVTVSPDGAEIADLVRAFAADAGPGRRRLLGLCGPPGAGKSTVAAAAAEVLGARAAVVPMDGFHLADAELARQGLLDRKGAPETFDAWGYAALLDRLRSRPEHPVYAPGFTRDLEQPLAGALAVPPSVDVVVTEGNYLLLDEPGWRAARAALDEVWFLCADERLRFGRLVARHVEFGKPPPAARAWVSSVDVPNAALVEAGAHRADRRLELSRWTGQYPRGFSGV